MMKQGSHIQLLLCTNEGSIVLKIIVFEVFYDVKYDISMFLESEP